MAKRHAQNVRPKIVIIGGGFGGIQLIRALKHADVDVLLLDRNNYHTFQPLLYQVATAGLEPDSVANSYREIFRKYKHFSFRMTEVLGLAPEKKQVLTRDGDVAYDYLVIATGSKPNFFFMKDIEVNGYPMKWVPEALKLREVIFTHLEKALWEKEDTRQALLNIAIIGGGPTGVELAGALGELKKKILPKDYPELDIRKMEIYLIDMADRLLPSMAESSSKHASDFLTRFGVQVCLKSKIASYDGHTLVMDNGRTIPTKNVIWTAGVCGNPIPGLKTEAVERSQIKVDPFNRVQSHEHIFAIGDVALMRSDKNPRGYPMVAPVAVQQGKRLAQNLQRLIRGENPRPFRYLNLGMMATIGRNNAVVEMGKIKLTGPIAWFLWLFVHLMALVGFRNKLIALTNWVWNYFTYDRSLRLIIEPLTKKCPPQTSP